MACMMRSTKASPVLTYLGILSWNADDFLWPGVLSAIAEIAEDLPNVDWLIGWMCIIDSLGIIPMGNQGLQFLPKAIIERGFADGAHWNFVLQENTFWRTRLWQTVGPYTVFTVFGRLGFVAQICTETRIIPYAATDRRIS